MSSKGVVTERTVRFNFDTCNNGAKYEALIVGLQMAKKHNIKRFKVFMDS